MWNLCLYDHYFIGSQTKIKRHGLGEKKKKKEKRKTLAVVLFA